jgi:hypothetical protein
LEDNDNPEVQFKKFIASKKTSSTTSATAELDLYLNKPTIDIDLASFDLLNWWKVNSLQFPTLLILAKSILMTPMTSIALESAFSTGGRILSDYRQSLASNTLEALICGQDWICEDEGLNNSKEDSTILIE